jgi:hypothetical protein
MTTFWFTEEFVLFPRSVPKGRLLALQTVCSSLLKGETAEGLSTHKEDER